MSSGSGGKQILVQHESGSKKGSFRYEAKSSEKHPLFATVYLMREGARKLLGIKDLDDVEEIEISVRAVSKSKKDASDEEDEEDD